MVIVSNRCNLAVQHRHFVRDGKESEWTVLRVIENDSTLEINDGGWDLSSIPTLVPCKAEISLIVTQGAKGQGLRLDPLHPPVIEVIK